MTELSLQHTVRKTLTTGAYQIVAAIWEDIGAASAASGATIPYVYGPRPPNVASDKTSWTADTRSFWFLYLAPVLLQGRFPHDKYYQHLLKLVGLLSQCLQFEVAVTEVEEIRQGFIDWVQKYEDYYYQHDPQHLSASPLTIHALLHIADSIILAGPVWAAWAFPMERYCGRLQPAIRSRRHPYSSLNRYVLDCARLDHIELLYDVRETLALRPPVTDHSTSISGSIREALPGSLGQWGKYELLVDKNARYRNRPVILEKKTFYGQLRQLLVIDLHPVPSAVPPQITSSTIVLGAIQRCLIENDHRTLDIHYYKRLGGLELVDITTVQCLVGRVQDRGRFAIIDRSGSLSRAIYNE
ncbi:hypothetical protein C2E23DRAFT_932379 [Lenzites betulinus]|nr:hypothetical protein C2E23DRAFT_932379 [Lenzites betulinus]